MNLKGFRVAMSVIAAALLAMMLSGCGGDDDGLSASDMARIDAAEMAAADAAAAAAAAQAAADEAAMEDDDIMDPPEPEYSPTDPGGTLEDVRDRAAAQRIWESADISPIIEGGVITGHMINGLEKSGAASGSVTQARLGRPLNLTVSVSGGQGLGTALHSADEDAPDLGDPWMGVNLERDGPGPIMQKALVYSDIEQSARAFGDVYPYNRNNMNEGGGASVGTAQNVVLTHRWIATVEAADDTDTTDVTETQSIILSKHSLVNLMHGLTTPGSNRPFGDGIRGTYHGVPGLFLCVAGAAGDGDCDVDVSDGGTAYVSDEDTGTDPVNLLFRADDPDVVLGDQDYLMFGVWSEVPDNPTLANPGRVRPFVHGNAGAFTEAHYGALSGSASYSGKAVGHWATRAQGSHMADAGRFTANATLAASFADGVSLSGTIDMFMDEAGEMDMAGWQVNLNAGMLEDSMVDNPAFDAEADPPTPMMISDAMEADILGNVDGYAGSRAWEGKWEAWMFGTHKDTTPTGVAGNFVALGGTPQPVTTPEARIDQFNDQGFAGVVGSFAGR